MGLGHVSVLFPIAVRQVGRSHFLELGVEDHFESADGASIQPVRAREARPFRRVENLVGTRGAFPRHRRDEGMCAICTYPSVGSNKGMYLAQKRRRGAPWVEGNKGGKAGVRSEAQRREPTPWNSETVRGKPMKLEPVAIVWQSSPRSSPRFIATAGRRLAIESR